MNRSYGEETKGIDNFDKNDFQEESVDTTEGINEFQKGKESDRLGFSHLPVLLRHLEDNATFSLTAFSLVGYVIIAAFGEMDSIGKYIGYLLIILFTISIYKFLQTDFDSKKSKIFFVPGGLVVIFLLLTILFAIYLASSDILVSINHYLFR